MIPACPVVWQKKKKKKRCGCSCNQLSPIWGLSVAGRWMSKCKYSEKDQACPVGRGAGRLVWVQRVKGRERGQEGGMKIDAFCLASS